jgi:23S rRNA (adenine2030-N6)-methyltransferase
LLSYQHSFHAGNHADVLKHITLCALLKKLLVKPKPFFYLDTHAGSACYEVGNNLINDPLAATNLPVDETTPQIVKSYLSIIESFLAKSAYPGSPLVANEALSLFAGTDEALKQAISRSNLQLCELHPSAFEALYMWTRRSGFHSHHRDGFELLNALMPPKPNRGLVLIDPPYEQAKEYDQVVQSVSNAIKKWPNGSFCIWYPLLSPERIDRQTQALEYSPKHGFSEGMLLSLTGVAKAANVGLLDIKFAKQLPSIEVGMYGSGMVIFNPPWQIDVDLEDALSYLNKNVQTEANDLSAISWLAPSP